MHRWSHREHGAPKEGQLFYGLLLAGLVATFRFPYFASWDGPAHVGSAAAFMHYGDAVREVFVRDFFPLPNLASHYLQAALLLIFKPQVVDRITAAGCVSAVAMAGRYLVRAINPAIGARMSYLLLALAFGWFVHGGQYSFLLGSAAALFYSALVVRRASDNRVLPPLADAALLVLLYCCHLVAFGVILLVKAIDTIDGTIRAPRSERLGTLIRRTAPSVPAGLLLAAYLAMRSAGGSSRDPLNQLAVNAATLRSVSVGFSTKNELLAVAPLVLAVVLVAIVLLHRGRDVLLERRIRPLMFAAIALAALYWIAPSNLGGGGFLSARLLLFSVALGLAASASGKRGHTSFAIAALAVASLTGLLWARQDEYAEFSDDLTELMEASQWMDRRDVVLTLMLCEERESGCASARATVNRPLSQASGLFMAETGAADLSLYESYFRYFPLQFSARTSAVRLLTDPGADIYSVPPPVDLSQYERESGITIDVVVLWGEKMMNDTVRRDPRTAALLTELTVGYNRVYASSRGHVTVYRRTGDEIIADVTRPA